MLVALLILPTGTPPAFAAPGEVVRCSTDSAGGQATGGDSRSPSVSADGRYVDFEANATNFVPGDTNGEFDIFRKELSAPYRFYCAEGYTGSGFQEYLCLGNAGTAPVTVKTTYLYRDGTSKEETRNVAGNSRVTINVNQAAGADREVSMDCEADAPFLAERPMYFSYPGLNN